MLNNTPAQSLHQLLGVNKTAKVKIATKTQQLILQVNNATIKIIVTFLKLLMK